jgi:hypothetical protein
MQPAGKAFSLRPDSFLTAVLEKSSKGDCSLSTNGVLRLRRGCRRVSAQDDKADNENPQDGKQNNDSRRLYWSRLRISPGSARSM